MNNEQIIKDTAEYNFNLGFQKGKLEERERILKLLSNHIGVLEELKYDDKGYAQGRIIIRAFNELKQQLQKEIGEEKGK